MSNVTLPTNSTDISQLFLYANTQTGGYFGVMVLAGIFLISWLSLQRFGNSTSAAIASYISSLFALMLFGLGILDMSVVFIMIVFAAFATAYLWVDTA